MTLSTHSYTKTDSIPAKDTRVKESTRAVAKIDRLDVHLLRELLQGPATLPLNPQFRRSFRSIARTLEIDEDTVRNRLRRLEECGFIQEWSIMLNPNLLGLQQTGVFLNVPSSIDKSELISRLKLIPDVFLILDMYGSDIGLMLAYDSTYSLKNKIELIQRLSKASDMTLSNALWPDCKIDLTITDWKILRSLQRDHRRSYASIAGEIGSSTRTVERRLKRMVQAGAIFAMVSLSPRAIEGTVLASLAVYHGVQHRLVVVRKVSEKLDDYLWHMFFTALTNSPGTLYTWFSLALPSVTKVREILDWAREQVEMREPKIELWHDHIVLVQALDHWLEGKLCSLGI